MDKEEKDEILEDDELLDGEETSSEDEELIDEEETSSEDEEKVPLKTFLELKAKYKSMKKNHAELLDKTLDNDSKSFIASKKQKYIDLGYDEALAEELAKDLAELKAEAKTSNRSHFEESIIEDINDLENDPVFSGIKLYTDEIIEKIKTTKRKTGEVLDTDLAYLLVSKKKARSSLRDERINNTQADVIAKKKAGVSGKTKVATSSSTTTKEQFKLDKDDLAALKMLQQFQPDANWTKEKYWKSRSMK
jgi:hypothetical protein